MKPPPLLRRRRSRERLRRGFYLIPSIFTVGNMLCGFLALVAASRGEMQRSAILILIAIFADVLDGRIARLTGTTSSFGAAYDSLADVVSFGAAPAFLALKWGLWSSPKLGSSVAFLFLVAGSIRLARFSTAAPDSRHFMGLPIPAGAGAIAMLVLLSPQPVSHPLFIPVVTVFVLALSLLMVSNLPYRSFKDLNLRRQWPAPTLFAIALVFSVVTFRPDLLAVLAGLYILSAPVGVLTRRLRGGPRDASPPAAQEPDDDEYETAGR